MPKPANLASFDAFLGQRMPLVRELHARADGSKWGLSAEDFGEGLRRSAEKRFQGTTCSERELGEYLGALHLEDLALACACSLGMEVAWEFFVTHFRQDLRHAARAMLRVSGLVDEARADELADSLHAELYGVRSDSDGRRKSLFEYFHGRSKLSTWLRAVLAQRQIDLFRTSGRTVSLDTDSEEELPQTSACRAQAVTGDPNRAEYLRRFENALSLALGSLMPRERLLLASYYIDGLNLAQIGAMLREHESTVSRQLERVRRALRERVTKTLQRDAPASNGNSPERGLDAAQMEVAFEYALEDWPFDLSSALSKVEKPEESPKE